VSAQITARADTADSMGKHTSR